MCARSYKLGCELGKRGAYVVTGFTPAKSVPHSAALGAYEAGSTAIGINVGNDIYYEDARAEPYSLIVNLGINSENRNVAFGFRDIVNVLAAHMLVAISGLIGTNHEIAVERLLFPNRPVAIDPQAGGIAGDLDKVYMHLEGGHPLISDNDPLSLAEKIVQASMLIQKSVDVKLPFFTDYLRKAGVPMVMVKSSEAE